MRKRALILGTNRLIGRALRKLTADDPDRGDGRGEKMVRP